MKRFSLFITFFLFVLQINAQVIKLEINPTSRPKGSLRLSDLVEQVGYIPLETKNNCIVGNIVDFDVSENYIVVYVAQTKEVFLFSRTGRFVSKIGRQGQSGAEYLEPNGVFIDELKKCVYLLDYRKLLMYDFTGKHLNTFSFIDNEGIVVGSSLAYLDNQFITGAMSGRKADDFVYKIWNSTMKLVKQGVKAVSVDVKGGATQVVVGRISCYIYRGLPHMKESSLNDTLYYVNKNNEFIPKYIINCGRYSWTAEEQGDTNNFYDYPHNDLL